MAEKDNDAVVNNLFIVDEVKKPTAAQSQAEPEYNEVEKRAMAQGWVPEDQYQGTGKWRSAEDFLDRGELFAKIDDQNRRIKAMDLTATELKKHLEKVRKTEYNRALETLRAEKKAALIEGDADAVLDVEAKIDTLKEEHSKEEVAAKQVQVNQAPDPAFVVWLNRNPWYNTSRAMKIYADDVGATLAVKGLPPNELLAEVERQVKKEFPEKFVNPNRKAASTVEGSSGRGSSTKEDFQLTEEETRVMNRFVKAGHMTKEEYIADIKADRTLERARRGV